MTNYEPLRLTRNFAASRQAVWDAWTMPEKFKQWYMPAPFSVASCKFDVRPGGSIEVEIQAPDGSLMAMSGEFETVDEPSRLVMINSPLAPSGQKLFEVQHTVVLTESGEGTRLEITSVVVSAGPDADQFLRGMEPGLNQALRQLGDLVEA